MIVAAPRAGHFGDDTNQMKLHEAALRRSGVESIETALVDVWAKIGYLEDASVTIHPDGRRLKRAVILHPQ
jgi:hypothetical protein